MLYPISTHTWQILRYILRAEAAGQAPFGRELRITPLRRTQDGTFLDDLVEEGLIAIAEEPGPDGKKGMEPAQFRTRYRLTERGHHAAECGEYDRPFVPRAAELTGLAAELAATLAKAKGPWSRKRTENAEPRKVKRKR